MQEIPGTRYPTRPAEGGFPIGEADHIGYYVAQYLIDHPDKRRPLTWTKTTTNNARQRKDAQTAALARKHELRNARMQEASQTRQIFTRDCKDGKTSPFNNHRYFEPITGVKMKPIRLWKAQFLMHKYLRCRGLDPGKLFKQRQRNDAFFDAELVSITFEPRGVDSVMIITVKGHDPMEICHVLPDDEPETEFKEIKQP